MELTLFQADAFARTVFQGNPAAVVPLKEWLADEVLQAIAAENNLSETAFFVPQEDHYHLRWFTPTTEVRLCGHATLASAHVLFQHLLYTGPELVFHTLGGTLRVRQAGRQYVLTFPADFPQATEVPAGLSEALGQPILELVKGTDDYLVLLDSAEQVQNLKPNFALLANLPQRGLIATAPGTETTIASRCFYPAYGINEDPVTGSAHTLLTPFWCARLGVENFTAIQGGTRRGYLECRLSGAEVELTGSAQTYLIGQIFI